MDLLRELLTDYKPAETLLQDSSTPPPTQLAPTSSEPPQAEELFNVLGVGMSRSELAQTANGQAYLKIQDDNKKGQRGFGEAIVDFQKEDAPFIGDILPVADIFRVRDTFKKLIAGQEITPDERVGAATYWADMERHAQQGTSGMVGDIIRQMPFFMGEIAAYSAAGSALGLGGVVGGTAVGAGELAGKKVVAKIANKMAGSALRKWVETVAGKEIATKYIPKVLATGVESVVTGTGWAASDAAINAVANLAIGQNAAETATGARRMLTNTMAKSDESDSWARIMGLGDRYFEYQSEAAGEFITELFPVGKVVAKISGHPDLDTAAGTWLRKAIERTYGAGSVEAQRAAKSATLGKILTDISVTKGIPLDKAFNFLEQAGWHGTIGEMAEERYGGFMKGLFGIEGDPQGGVANALDQMIPDPQQLKAEAIGFAIPGVSVAAANAAQVALRGGLTNYQRLTRNVAAAARPDFTKDVVILSDALRGGEPSAATKSETSPAQADQPDGPESVAQLVDMLERPDPKFGFVGKVMSGLLDVVKGLATFSMGDRQSVADMDQYFTSAGLGNFGLTHQMYRDAYLDNKGVTKDTATEEQLTKAREFAKTHVAELMAATREKVLVHREQAQNLLDEARDSLTKAGKQATPEALVSWLNDNSKDIDTSPLIRTNDRNGEPMWLRRTSPLLDDTNDPMAPVARKLLEKLGSGGDVDMDKLSGSGQIDHALTAISLDGKDTSTLRRIASDPLSIDGIIMSRQMDMPLDSKDGILRFQAALRDIADRTDLVNKHTFVNDKGAAVFVDVPPDEASNKVRVTGLNSAGHLAARGVNVVEPESTPQKDVLTAVITQLEGQGFRMVGDRKTMILPKVSMSFGTARSVKSFLDTIRGEYSTAPVFGADVKDSRVMEEAGKWMVDSFGATIDKGTGRIRVGMGARNTADTLYVPLRGTTYHVMEDVLEQYRRVARKTEALSKGQTDTTLSRAEADWMAEARKYLASRSGTDKSADTLKGLFKENAKDSSAIPKVFLLHALGYDFSDVKLPYKKELMAHMDALTTGNSAFPAYAHEMASLLGAVDSKTGMIDKTKMMSLINPELPQEFKEKVLARTAGVKVSPEKAAKAAKEKAKESVKSEEEGKPEKPAEPVKTEKPAPKSAAVTPPATGTIEEKLMQLAGTEERYKVWSNTRDGSDMQQFQDAVTSPATQLRSVLPEDITYEGVDALLQGNKAYANKDLRAKAVEILLSEFGRKKEEAPGKKETEEPPAVLDADSGFDVLGDVEVEGLSISAEEDEQSLLKNVLEFAAAYRLRKRRDTLTNDEIYSEDTLNYITRLRVQGYGEDDLREMFEKLRASSGMAATATKAPIKSLADIPASAATEDTDLQSKPGESYGETSGGDSMAKTRAVRAALVVLAAHSGAIRNTSQAIAWLMEQIKKHDFLNDNNPLRNPKDFAAWANAKSTDRDDNLLKNVFKVLNFSRSWLVIQRTGNASVRPLISFKREMRTFKDGKTSYTLEVIDHTTGKDYLGIQPARTAARNNASKVSEAQRKELTGMALAALRDLGWSDKASSGKAPVDSRKTLAERREVVDYVKRTLSILTGPEFSWDWLSADWMTDTDQGNKAWKSLVAVYATSTFLFANGGEKDGKVALIKAQASSQGWEDFVRRRVLKQMFASSQKKGKDANITRNPLISLWLDRQILMYQAADRAQFGGKSRSPIEYDDWQTDAANELNRENGLDKAPRDQRFAVHRILGDVLTQEVYDQATGRMVKLSPVTRLGEKISAELRNGELFQQEWELMRKQPDKYKGVHLPLTSGDKLGYYAMFIPYAYIKDEATADAAFAKAAQAVIAKITGSARVSVMEYLKRSHQVSSADMQSFAPIDGGVPESFKFLVFDGKIGDGSAKLIGDMRDKVRVSVGDKNARYLKMHYIQPASVDDPGVVLGKAAWDLEEYDEDSAEGRIEKALKGKYGGYSNRGSFKIGPFDDKHQVEVTIEGKKFKAWEITLKRKHFDTVGSLQHDTRLHIQPEPLPLLYDMILGKYYPNNQIMKHVADHAAWMSAHAAEVYSLLDFDSDREALQKELLDAGLKQGFGPIADAAYQALSSRITTHLRPYGVGAYLAHVPASSILGEVDPYILDIDINEGKPRPALVRANIRSSDVRYGYSILELNEAKLWRTLAEYEKARVAAKAEDAGTAEQGTYLRLHEQIAKMLKDSKGQPPAEWTAFDDLFDEDASGELVPRTHEMREVNGIGYLPGTKLLVHRTPGGDTHAHVYARLSEPVSWVKNAHTGLWQSGNANFIKMHDKTVDRGGIDYDGDMTFVQLLARGGRDGHVLHDGDIKTTLFGSEVPTDEKARARRDRDLQREFDLRRNVAGNKVLASVFEAYDNLPLERLQSSIDKNYLDETQVYDVGGTRRSLSSIVREEKDSDKAKADLSPYYKRGTAAYYQDLARASSTMRGIIVSTIGSFNLMLRNDSVDYGVANKESREMTPFGVALGLPAMRTDKGDARESSDAIIHQVLQNLVNIVIDDISEIRTPYLGLSDTTMPIFTTLLVGQHFTSKADVIAFMNKWVELARSPIMKEWVRINREELTLSRNERYDALREFDRKNGGDGSRAQDITDIVEANGELRQAGQYLVPQKTQPGTIPEFTRFSRAGARAHTPDAYRFINGMDAFAQDLLSGYAAGTAYEQALARVAFNPVFGDFAVAPFDEVLSRMERNGKLPGEAGSEKQFDISESQQEVLVDMLRTAPMLEALVNRLGTDLTTKYLELYATNASRKVSDAKYFNMRQALMDLGVKVLEGLREIHVNPDTPHNPAMDVLDIKVQKKDGKYVDAYLISDLKRHNATDEEIASVRSGMENLSGGQPVIILPTAFAGYPEMTTLYGQKRVPEMTIPADKVLDALFLSFLADNNVSGLSRAQGSALALFPPAYLKKLNDEAAIIADKRNADTMALYETHVATLEKNGKEIRYVNDKWAPESLKVPAGILSVAAKPKGVINSGKETQGRQAQGVLSKPAAVKQEPEALKVPAPAAPVQATVPAGLELGLSDEKSYPPRTRENVAAADVTISIARDFTTAGERLTINTAKSLKKPVLMIPHEAEDMYLHVQAAIPVLNELAAAKDAPLIINGAGNGAYTLKTANAQQVADEYAYNFLKALVDSPDSRFEIGQVRTGGQSGYDVALAKAAMRLGIPAKIHAARGMNGGYLVRIPVGVGYQDKELTSGQYIKFFGFDKVVPDAAASPIGNKPAEKPAPVAEKTPSVTPEAPKEAPSGAPAVNAGDIRIGDVVRNAEGQGGKVVSQSIDGMEVEFDGGSFAGMVMPMAYDELVTHIPAKAQPAASVPSEQGVDSETTRLANQYIDSLAERPVSEINTPSIQRRLTLGYTRATQVLEEVKRIMAERKQPAASAPSAPITDSMTDIVRTGDYELQFTHEGQRYRLSHNKNGEITDVRPVGPSGSYSFDASVYRKADALKQALKGTNISVFGKVPMRSEIPRTGPVTSKPVVAPREINGQKYLPSQIVPGKLVLANGAMVDATRDQARALADVTATLADGLTNTGTGGTMLVSGAPGTGKTTIMKEVMRRLRLVHGTDANNILFAAPTHQAAGVISMLTAFWNRFASNSESKVAKNKLKTMSTTALLGGQVTAPIDGKTGRPKSGYKQYGSSWYPVPEEALYAKFPPPIVDARGVVVDEVSMLSDAELQLLLEYQKVMKVQRRRLLPIILSGDKAQIPQVRAGVEKGQQSEADIGLAFRLQGLHSVELTEIMRQQKANPLVGILTNMREAILGKDVDAVRQQLAVPVSESVTQDGDGYAAIGSANAAFANLKDALTPDLFTRDPLSFRVYAPTNARVREWNVKVFSHLYPGQSLDTLPAGTLVKAYVNSPSPKSKEPGPELDALQSLFRIAGDYHNSDDFIVRRTGEEQDFGGPFQELAKLRGRYVDLERATPGEPLTGEASTRIFKIPASQERAFLTGIMALRARAAKLAKERNWGSYWDLSDAIAFAAANITSMSAIKSTGASDRAAEKGGAGGIDKSFDLGYASTVHKGQGSTIKVALMDTIGLAQSLFGLWDKLQILYVGLSRASKAAIAITERAGNEWSPTTGEALRAVLNKASIDTRPPEFVENASDYGRLKVKLEPHNVANTAVSMPAIEKPAQKPVPKKVMTEDELNAQLNSEAEEPPVTEAEGFSIDAGADQTGLKLPEYLKRYDGVRAQPDWSKLLKDTSDYLKANKGGLTAELIDKVLLHPKVLDLIPEDLVLGVMRVPTLRAFAEIDPRMQGYGDMFDELPDVVQGVLEGSYAGYHQGRVGNTSPLIVLTGSQDDVYVARTLVHELLHEISKKLLSTDPSFAAEMARLLALAKQDANLEYEYGTGNVHEFVSELFSNPSFRRKLAGIADPNGPQRQGTIWDSILDLFIKAFKKLLGSDAVGGSIAASALDGVFSAMQQLSNTSFPSAIAKSLDIEYNGEQKIPGAPSEWVFTDPVYGGTIQVPENSPTWYVKQRIEAKRQEFIDAGDKPLAPKATPAPGQARSPQHRLTQLAYRLVSDRLPAGTKKDSALFHSTLGAMHQKLNGLRNALKDATHVEDVRNAVERAIRYGQAPSEIATPMLTWAEAHMPYADKASYRNKLFFDSQYVRSRYIPPAAEAQSPTRREEQMLLDLQPREDYGYSIAYMDDMKSILVSPFFRRGTPGIGKTLFDESNWLTQLIGSNHRWYIPLMQEWGMFSSDGVIPKIVDRLEADNLGAKGGEPRFSYNPGRPGGTAAQLTPAELQLVHLVHQAANAMLEILDEKSGKADYLQADLKSRVRIKLPIGETEKLKEILPEDIANELIRMRDEVLKSVGAAVSGTLGRNQKAIAAMDKLGIIDYVNHRSEEAPKKGPDTEWSADKVIWAVPSRLIEKMFETSSARKKLIDEGGRDPKRISMRFLAAQAAQEYERLYNDIESHVPSLVGTDAGYLRHRLGYTQHRFGMGFMGVQEEAILRLLDKPLREVEEERMKAFETTMKYAKHSDGTPKSYAEASESMLRYLFEAKGLPWLGYKDAVNRIAGRGGKSDADYLANLGLHKDMTFADVASEIHKEVMNQLTARALAKENVNAPMGATLTDPLAVAKYVGKMLSTFKNREYSARTRARMYRTYDQAYREGGLVPDNLGAIDSVRRYAADIGTQAMKEVALNQMILQQDPDGTPLIIADPVEEFEGENVIKAQVWDLHAKMLSDYFGHVYDSSKSAKQNIKAMIDRYVLKNTNYKPVESTHASIAKFHTFTRGMAQESAMDMMASGMGRSGGEVGNYLKHIENEAWTDPWGVLDKVLHVNGWMKMLSLQGSLFFGVAGLESLVAATGGKILGGKALAPKGMPGLLELRRMYRSNHPYIMELMRDTESLGSKFAYPATNIMDEPVTQLDKDITKLSAVAERVTGSKFVGQQARGLGGLLRAQSRLIFEEQYNLMKLYLLMRFDLESREQAAKAGVKYDRKAALAPWVRIFDEAIGGTNEARYSWMTPTFRRVMSLLMFSFPWTFSAWNIAGGGVLTGPFLKNHLTQEEINFIMLRNWPAMLMFVLVAPVALLQLGVYLAAGDDDDKAKEMVDKAKRDTPWVWQNEPGRQLYSDITPIMRKMPWYKGDPTGDRRVYVHWGKQSWEILGWFDKPYAQFTSKLSQVARWGIEQATGETVGMGWDLGFKGMGLTGLLLDDEGGVTGSRLGHTVGKFLPFSILAAAQNRDGIPLQIVAPVSRGMSFNAASNAYLALLKTWADKATYKDVYGNHLVQANLEALGNDILEAARNNGYDPKKVLDSAKAAALKEYYAKLFQAISAKDVEKVEEVSRSIARLNGTIEGVRRSVMNRNHLYGKPAAITPEQQAILREAFQKPSK